MFKSVFSKYFVSISAIIMSSFLVMTTIQVLLFTRSVAQDKRTLLTENAGNIARHTAISAVESQTQGSGGVIYRLDQAGMNQFLTMMSDAIARRYSPFSTRSVIWAVWPKSGSTPPRPPYG